MGRFLTVNDQFLLNAVLTAQKRVIAVGPGISTPLAQSIAQFAERQGAANVEIILDADPEVCRLGYGTIGAVELLADIGVVIRKSPGLRIGLCVIDDNAWIFTPTPLVVEDTPENGKSNAVILDSYQAELMLKAICPTIGQNRRPQLLAPDAIPEIGMERLTKQDVAVAKEDLQARPPQQFDLARKVRVFQSCLQFVELKVEGCELRRHTVSIPNHLLKLNKKKQDQDRLKATCKLIRDNTQLPTDIVNQRVAKLRKDYTVSAGERFGRVILKRNLEKFQKELESIKREMESANISLYKKVEAELKRCRKELITLLTPVVRANPPEQFFLFHDKATTEAVQGYLNEELDNVMPDIKDVMAKMSVTCIFKDVTYTMLNDQEFHRARHMKSFLEKNNLYSETDAITEKHDESGQVLLF